MQNRYCEHYTKYDIIRKGGDILPYTKAQNKATQRYQAKAYDRLAIRVKKGEAEIIKAQAEGQGLSLNGDINKLIKDDMQKKQG